MSDTQQTPEAPKPAPPAQAQPEATQPEVDKVDWKAEARKWEERAKANKTAADKLTEIEEAQKSEAQKAAERLAEAEKSAAQARTEALRLRTAAKYGISDEDADLFLTGNDEDTLAKQAERLAARVEDAGRPRAPKPDPNQGRSGVGPKSTADSFADFFRQNL